MHFTEQQTESTQKHRQANNDRARDGERTRGIFCKVPQRSVVLWGETREKKRAGGGWQWSGVRERQRDSWEEFGKEEMKELKTAGCLETVRTMDPSSLQKDIITVLYMWYTVWQSHWDLWLCNLVSRWHCHSDEPCSWCKWSCCYLKCCHYIHRGK